jgi:hypothetical protein
MAERRASNADIKAGAGIAAGLPSGPLRRLNSFPASSKRRATSRIPPTSRRSVRRQKPPSQYLQSDLLALRLLTFASWAWRRRTRWRCQQRELVKEGSAMTENVG